MLSRDLARHVEQRRSLGFKCHSEHILLRGFVAFAERRGDTYVKSTRVLAWAAEAPSPEQRRNRLHTVRRFALAIQAEDRRHQVPAADALGRPRVRRRAPYIYKPHDIVRLLRAAAALESAGSIRPIMYTTLFGLLAATGMRIAEALALQLHDVTSDGLVVRESKYHKSRLFRLPMHATTRQALDRYLRVSELVGLRLDQIDRQGLTTVHIVGKGRRERVLPLWKETAVAVKQHAPLPRSLACRRPIRSSKRDRRNRDRAEHEHYLAGHSCAQRQIWRSFFIPKMCRRLPYCTFPPPTLGSDPPALGCSAGRRPDVAVIEDTVHCTQGCSDRGPTTKRICARAQLHAPWPV
jgi:integrase